MSDLAGPARYGVVQGRLVQIIRGLDPILLSSAIGLSIFGVLMVYSSTHHTLQLLDLEPFSTTAKQIVAMALGLGLMVLAASFDYRLAKVYAPIAYVGIVVLLLLVLSPFGSDTAGAQRGFEVGIQITPSEYMKIGLICMLAAFLSDQRGSDLDLRLVFRASAIAAVPMLLVFLQPDLGTSIVLAAILVGILVVAGARPRHLGVLALVAMVLMFAAFQMKVIKDYQIDRLTSFISKDADPRGSGFNLEQSEIAIGSGGITGRGYLKGPQTNLDFVPEQHSDFIFTVVGEEFGFVGGMFVLVLFGVMLWRAFRIAAGAKDRFGTYVAAGIIAMWSLQMFVNIGMTIGIMPITGIPLPFLSYGGSSLVTNFVAVGLLLNINMRRFSL